MLWILGAGAVGFAASAIFSGWLRWSRTAFVLPYALLALAFLAVYVRRQGINPLIQLRRRWKTGTAAGLLLGLFLWQGILSQPGSSRPGGAALIAALAWFGLVYGATDALLLNIVPVLSIYGTMPRHRLANHVSRLGWGFVALVASLSVTALYHLGFTEFQGPELVQPLVGNGLMTVGYLLTGSPLTALIAHMVMHMAVVIHGMETTLQLPPHYAVQ
jgi:hypothetical protein